MVKSVVNSVVTYYPGSHYQKVVNGSTVTEQKFYSFGGQTVAVRTIQGGQDTLKWIIDDQVGSTSVTANADGTWNSEIKYTAFGEVRSSSGITPIDRRYTGQRVEEELGLQFYKARWYDPAAAHFVQSDNIIPDPKNAKAWDRYAYVENNPIKYNDPGGKCKYLYGIIEDPNDSACWNKYHQIQKDYPNVALYTPGAWTLDQLNKIAEALELIKNVFKNIDYFIKALGYFSISTYNFIFGGMTPTEHSILLGPDFSRETVIHEIGHIFDFRGGFGKKYTGKYKSQEFIDEFDKTCIAHSLGCVGYPELMDDVNHKNNTWIYAFLSLVPFSYNPGDGTTDAGKVSSIDDFAESFVAYVLEKNNISDGIHDVVNQARRDIIRRNIEEIWK